MLNTIVLVLTNFGWFLFHYFVCGLVASLVLLLVSRIIAWLWRIEISEVVTINTIYGVLAISFVALAVKRYGIWAYILLPVLALVLYVLWKDEQANSSVKVPDKQRM